MAIRKARYPKLAKEELHAIIYQALENGALLYSGHARPRLREREIIDVSVEQILSNRKNHRPSRDRFDEDLDAWSYCFEGADLDLRALRVIVAIDPKQRVVVVTVVDVQSNGDL